MTTTAPETLFLATAGGSCKHLAQCPHLVGSTAAPVEPGRLLRLCDWCDKELTGFGRRRFPHLDAALDAFRVPAQNRALIKQHLSGVVHDEVYLPYSESYVALAWGGRGVAWSGKTYVVPEPGVSIELPGFVGGSRTPLGAPGERWGDTCPVCRETRALNGACSC